MKLLDNREYQAMTVEQADALFLKIAKAKAAMDREADGYRKRLAELEEAHRAKMAERKAACDEMTDRLTAYILANPSRFQKPRKHPVGQIGTYGITTDPAYVVFDDKEAAVQFALENGYDDMLRTTYVPDKDAVMRRSLAGESIPGARVVPPGDVAKLAFRKGFADQLED